MFRKSLSIVVVAYGLFIVAMVSCGKKSGEQIMTNQPEPPKPIVLPPGVEKLVIGKAFNNQQDCRITDSLSLPIRFPAGTTHVAYQLVIPILVVDPNRVHSVQISLRGDGLEGGLQTVFCDKYAIILGVPKQFQWGGTINRAGGLAFKAGSYVLKFTVDGNAVEVPFTVQ
jgi:hypothetical protein